ncbi:protocadherin Fat 4-like [Cylas formicarius]|uniref:protocadherin Fat 4-like n=1 Tax=Cylas formicarius TaxID=197179 RepID=UPI002958844D|nr:protocadherin Fat 4-like [Cylas formicarius]
MGRPWYILFIILWLRLEVGGFTIEKGEKMINLTNDESKYTLYMNENNHDADNDETLLFTIAEDSMSDTPSFIFLQADTTFKYSLRPNDNTFDFYATQYFDYETQPNLYQLMYTINDQPGLIILNIVNIDDEPPSLTSPMCTFPENAIFDITDTQCGCTVSDPDGWLDQMTFNIINTKAEEAELFEFMYNGTIADNVYEAPVYIILKKELDYEETTFYSFNVQAQDGAKHNTTPNAYVRSIIYVEDQNDMPPEFTNFFTTAQFNEKEEQTFNVTAVDGDKGINADIVYSVIKDDVEKCVSIDKNSGVITVKPIDRDARDILTYQFTIMAQETDDPPFNTTLDITFFIQDIDDQDPVFMAVKDSSGNENNTYEETDTKVANFKFLENFDGTLNAKFNITDRDTGENAQFKVELEQHEPASAPVDYTEAFIVVPTAGYRTGDFLISVINKTKLDYEDPDWDNFQFYVHSIGTKNNTKQDRILINISLIDYNDEYPKFADEEYTVDINETLEYGEFIIQVMATDRDAEDKVLRHELVGSTTITSLLRIDSDTGKIFVDKENAFDYDRINPIFVQVRAYDKVNHTATVPVTIHLLDVNNKKPTIEVNDLIRVEENQKIGTILNTSIVASDVDTTRNLSAEINWDASYAMKNSQPLNNSDPDIIQQIKFLNLDYVTDPDTGSITIQLTINDNNADETTPDYELFDTLYLSIIVTDWNTDPDFLTNMNTTALITINIIDINDNPPIFTNETLVANRTAYEEANEGIIVGTILATDKDVGDVVTYSCECLDERDWFEVNEKNGEFRVKTSKTVDADSYPKDFTVDYNCSATDTLHYTYARFSIYILDTNNKIPQYVDDMEEEYIGIPEQSEAETPLTQIELTDQDRDIPYHTVTCYFTNTSEPCYSSFQIVANWVTVLNGGNDLNRDTGIRKYDCSVRCIDNSGREQSGDQKYNDTKISIIVEDINNNAPQLITTEISGSENLKKNQVIGKVQAMDIDEGLNATIDFEITQVLKENVDYTKEDLFFFDKMDDYNESETTKLGTLKANKDLRDYYGEYTLKLLLSDEGTPQMFNDTTSLTVKIERFNYHSPTFLFPGDNDKSLVLSTDQEPYSQLTQYLQSKVVPDIKISDSDDDTCSTKWNPTLDVTQTEPSGISIFLINTTSAADECTGQLQLNTYFDKNLVVNKMYSLTLTARLEEGTAPSDQEPYESSVFLEITFLDVTQDPIFDQTKGPWKLSFREQYLPDPETLPKNLEAYYPNVTDLSKFYFLYTDDQDVEDTFKVDPTTGSLSLLQMLDYSIHTTYNFQIVASKNQSGISSNKASYLDVAVTVIEINNHSPEWDQPTFFGAIMSTYPRNTKILTASATDKDVIDQGKLEYAINSTFERSGSSSINTVNDPPFLLSTTTGDITLNFAVDNSMTGHFWFNISVKDRQDDYGNGPHFNFTTVTIYIVTTEHTVNFRFGNVLSAVLNNQAEILGIISNILGNDCYAQNIDVDSQEGQDLDNQTLASVYCVEDNTLVSSEEILKKVASLTTFQNLRSTLMGNASVWLLPFTSESTPENLEEVLKASIIGVTVVLGAACFILSVTFFFKMRELNTRLKKLTEPKFGSDESDLNRKGINGVNAPNTNIHAVEGSNPVFNNEIIKNKDFEYDKKSIHSGDSDLIGIEDSPEFDFFEKSIGTE